MAPNNEQNTVITETYWQKRGIPRVSTGHAVEQLKLTLTSGQVRGVTCWVGEAGDGKTQAVHALAKKLGYRVLDIRTAQFTMMSAGIPSTNGVERGFFQIAVPHDFPKKNEKVILLFDEYNQGSSHAIAMFFQLLEDRKLYDYELPRECHIVALMNPSTTNYSTVNKIEGNAALNRRMTVYFVYMSFPDWMAYAQSEEFHWTDGIQKPCHPSIVKFLRTSPSFLYTSKERDRGQQFACPATWQTVSLSLYNCEAAGHALTSSFVENRVAASIGELNAAALCSYIRDENTRVNPLDILNYYTEKSEIRGRVLSLVEKNKPALLDLCDALAMTLYEQKLPPKNVASKLARFWNDVPPEVAQTFFTQLHAASKSVGEVQKNTTYMRDLTLLLSADPNYVELVKRTSSAFSEFADGMQKLTK